MNTDSNRSHTLITYFRYYIYLATVCSFIIPTMVPCTMWNENLWISFFVVALLRHCCTMHTTWLTYSWKNIFCRPNMRHDCLSKDYPVRHNSRSSHIVLKLHALLHSTTVLLKNKFYF